MHMEGGSFTFQTINRGVMSFFGNLNSKISRCNTRRGYFFHYCCKLVHGTVQKTMLQHVQSDIIHLFACLEKGGICYFSHPEGGQVMQFCHLGMGGSTFFFLLRGAVRHPPLPAEIYEQSLMMQIFKNIPFVPDLFTWTYKRQNYFH